MSNLNGWGGLPGASGPQVNPEDTGVPHKKKGKKVSSKSHACYQTHPPLVFTVPEGGKYKAGTYTIYGGNAYSPIHPDCDIYVSHTGELSGFGSKPWNKSNGVIDTDYYITDMAVPKNVSEYRKMVEWLCNRLQDGKKVHVGCIGGHGRTGTTLSAVVAEMTGDPKAISYVRKHYCKKAVESEEQAEFLHINFGCDMVAGAKKSFAPPPGSYQGGWMPQSTAVGDSAKSHAFRTAKRSIPFVPSDKSIFLSPVSKKIQKNLFGGE